MQIKTFIQRRSVVAYIGLVPLISYGSFLLVAGPNLLHGSSGQPGTGEYVLFPITVLSVCLVGLALTARQPVPVQETKAVIE